MPGIRQNIVVAISMAVFLSCSLVPAFAEYCSMIGCRGEVGYVFLPGDPYVVKNKHFFRNRQECALPKGDNPFGTVDLPEVNATVSVARLSNLLTDQDIEKNLGAFGSDDMEPTGNGAECRVTWKEPELGNLLDAGIKVRILGYRTFVGHRTVTGDVRTVTFDTQLLFALVIVEN
jgi:hypothetical protein